MKKIMDRVKRIYEGFRKNTLLKISVSAALVIMLMTSIAVASYSDNINEGLADSLIRLHVIANSDDPQDQQLKGKVRDAILEYMRDQLKESKDIEQTKYILNRDIKVIEEIAGSVINDNGRSYGVKAMLGTYPFPTKAYGDIVLPAGNYQALRVVIGDGQGANWWCVLFPPLCFVDASHGTVPSSVKEDLSEVLTDEEYKIITDSEDNRGISVKAKFKTVEVFQKVKQKVSGIWTKSKK